MTCASLRNPTNGLVSERLELFLHLAIHIRALLRVHELLPECLLALVVRRALDFSPLLEPAIITLANQLTPHNLPYPLRSITYLSTTSLYFQPNSTPSLPTVQYLRPGFSLSTLSACGTTILFLWSYGGGTPSKVLRRSMAAAPRWVLCGIMPRTVRQNILDGVLKCHGPPRIGL